MRMSILAGVAALALAGPAIAQDASTTTTTTTMDPNTSMGTSTMGANSMDTNTNGVTTSAGATTSDGSSLFGFEPYFGVLGGYHSFDRKAGFTGPNGERFDGAQIEGVLGANLPIGPLFIGVEGHGAKGFGDISWEYGVRGRAGVRVGDSGLIYGSFGRTWIDAKNERGFPNRDDWVYGLGLEVGPGDIGLGGITGQAGPRLRVSVETYDMKSIRPMAGVIFHF